jgi:hypothetical protein
MSGSPFDAPYVRSASVLIRRLLDLNMESSLPAGDTAVVMVHFFTEHGGRGFFTGQESHDLVAKYFRVPAISVRDALAVSNGLSELPSDIRLGPSHRASFTSREDGYHPSAAGHRLAADLVIHYLQGVVCELRRQMHNAKSLGPNSLQLSDLALPARDVFGESIVLMHGNGGRCVSLVGGTSSLVPAEHTGWEILEERTTTNTRSKRYWQSKVTGSTIDFPLGSSKKGQAFLYHIKSNAVSMGSVACMVVEDGSTLAGGSADTTITGSTLLPHTVGYLEAVGPPLEQVHPTALRKSVPPVELLLRCTHMGPQGRPFRVLAVVVD